MTERVPTCLPMIEKAEFAAFRQLMDRRFQRKFRNYTDWLVQHRLWVDQFGEGQPALIMIRISDFAGSELLRAGPSTLNQLLDYTERVGEVSSS